MTPRPASSSLEEEEDWEIITTHCWRTHFSAVSWSFRPPQDPLRPRKCFHGSLFRITDPGRSAVASESNPNHSASHQSHAPPHADNSLNPDLPGVQAALHAVRIYEEGVGFNFTPFPEITPRELDIYSAPRLVLDADEALLRSHQLRWQEAVQDLMDPNLIHVESGDSPSSPVLESLSSSIDLNQSTSLSTEANSSDGSVDSFVMPETPKAKGSLTTSVEINDLSASPNESLSPGRALNASASSFVPTFLSQLHDEPLHYPSLNDALSTSRQKKGKNKPKIPTTPTMSFTNFTFPSLNPSTSVSSQSEPTPVDDIKIEPPPDALPSGDLLPPFLQDTGNRNRSRKSRTREIVDRLRSRASLNKGSQLEDMSIKFSSQSPSPMCDESTSLSPIRRSVSEDGGDQFLDSMSSLNDEEEAGWIDVSPPAVVSPKPNRARDLVLALARRRTDSTSFEIVREGSASTSLDDNSPPPSASASASVVPNAHDDGWIEPAALSPSKSVHDSAPAPQVQQSSYQPKLKSSPVPPRSPHNRKHSSKTHISRSSMSSTAPSSPTAFAFGGGSASPNAYALGLSPQHVQPYFYPAYPNSVMPVGAVPYALGAGAPFLPFGVGPLPLSTGAGMNGPPPGIGFSPVGKPHMLPNMTYVGGVVPLSPVHQTSPSYGKKAW